jgi:peptide/nickel transport system ATP-binding protein/oligopeptide transport system ATP-binding protein
MATLLITHNLGIVAETSDRVAVMYAGKIVETARVGDLFESPAHPYTRGLLNSIPADDPGRKLEPIPGVVPNPAFLPEGCAFHPRCQEAMPRCRMEIPGDSANGNNIDHRVACWLYDKP